MLYKIIGVIWLIWGILFCIWPQLLLRRIQKKGFKKLRKYFLIIGIIMAYVLLSFGLKYSGILPKIIFIFGILTVIKMLILLKGKAAEHMMEWSMKLPQYALRIAGAINALIGLTLIYFS